MGFWLSIRGKLLYYWTVYSRCQRDAGNANAKLLSQRNAGKAANFRSRGDPWTHGRQLRDSATRSGDAGRHISTCS